MKRFTDTEIWDKLWFRKLTPRLKALWKYLCDRCDSAGVLDADWEAMGFYIGEPCSEADLEHFNGNVVMRKGNIFLPQFAEFQYTRLSRECKPHEKVFEAMARHGLKESDLFKRPVQLPLPQGKPADPSGTPARHKGGNGAKSVYEMTKILEAKEHLAGQIKDKYSSDGAMGATWNDETKHGEWKKLRGEIKALNEQIAGMA